MEFCKKCGGILVPKKVGGKTVLVCRNCGKKSGDGKGVTITEKVKSEENIKTIEQKKEDLPTTTESPCPKCGNREAFWWMQQTRSVDEPPTRFYKCTKCGHVWREYS